MAGLLRFLFRGTSATLRGLRRMRCDMWAASLERAAVSVCVQCQAFSDGNGDVTLDVSGDVAGSPSLLV